MLVDGGLAAVLAFLGVASGVAMAFHPGASVAPASPIVHGPAAVTVARVAAIPLALLLAVPVIFRR